MSSNTTGDLMGHVADLFQDHHAGFNDGIHGGQTVVSPDSLRDSQSWTESVGKRRCAAVEAHMDFAPSQKALDAIERILNSPRGTPEQRLHAIHWLSQRKPQMSWLDKMLSMVGFGPSQGKD